MDTAIRLYHNARALERSSINPEVKAMGRSAKRKALSAIFFGD